MDSISDKLQPCPFCGGTKLHIESFYMSNRFFVQCENDDCGADGPVDLGQSGAVEKWNERASQPTCTWTRGEYEESVWATSCSQLFILDDGTPDDNEMHFCAFCGRSLVVATPEVDDE